MNKAHFKDYDNLKMVQRYRQGRSTFPLFSSEMIKTLGVLEAKIVTLANFTGKMCNLITKDKRNSS